MHEHTPDRPSRRDILKQMPAAVVGTAMTGGCAFQSHFHPPDNSKPEPITGPESTATLASSKHLTADVVVVGGGLAGTCAAIAAARNGASVILVQDRPVLGGNASSEIRMHVCGADCSGGRSDTDARESGIIEELRLENSVRNPQRSASVYDLTLYEWVRRESNITLLLNTACRGVRTCAGKIEAVLASCPGTEDEFTIGGKLFIDCSGDGRLGAEADAEFRMGREARDQYGESLAPPAADHKTLGSTLLFITRHHDRPMPFQPPPWIRKFARCEDLPHRSHGSWEYGFWWVEWGGELNTIKDGAHIGDELLAAALGVWDHIKNSGQHPQSVNWALEWLGFLPGKRESRRFIGDYVLTQHDLQRGERFPDGVAYGGWSIDLHPPAGIDTAEPPCHQPPTPLYNIPLRSLYSRNVPNLLFAGRNISATHVAFGSTRVMATCAVMGQAVGTAAAMCAARNILPRELAQDGMAELQQQLLRDDAYIIGIANTDPNDWARSATVSASSETADGPAKNIINGIHRGESAESNRWISDPQQPLPQWIELRFPRPQRIREVHLTFDTGLHRPLTHTHNDDFHKRMMHGPQPETVRDYELHLLSGTESHLVVQEQGNYQRKRIHRFDPQDADGVRLTVRATNGSSSARLFEIRAYA